MTILISIFGFAGRFAGDLLTSALGWASSLLFGRVPRSHQIFLVLMMAWSFLWVLVVLALLLPSIASFMLSATPHPPFVDYAWLGFALLVAAIVLPLGVGLAGYLVPAEGERRGGPAIVREILRGYLLAPLISGLLIFLAAVGIVRKIRSKRHGWSDIHVPIVVKPGGYDQMVADLEDALVSANLAVTASDAPRVLTVPAWLLTRVAGDNVRKLRPDRLIELSGSNLRIGLYPSDVAVSGGLKDRIRARTAILSRLAMSSAHLTTSAEAQALEDRLTALAKSGAPAADDRAVAFTQIDAMLLDLAVPTDEWDILYRLRLQIERDLLAGVEPGTAFPGHEANAAEVGVSSRSTSRDPGAEDVPVTDTPRPAAGDRPAGHPEARKADVGWLTIALVSLAGLVALTFAVASKVVFPFDLPLLTVAHGWDGNPDVWKAISETANIPLIVIGLGFVVWLFRTKRRREALLVLLMLIAVTAGSEGIKQLTLRPRPETGTAAGIPGVVYSYPSGHVLEALTILGFVALRLWRSAVALALRLAVVTLVVIDVVLVGIARLALNAHYPTDVLAGVLGAIGALGLYAWLTRPGAWADKPPQTRRGPTARPKGPTG